MSIQKETKEKMAAAVEHLKEELKGVRTGQAHPHMLDKVSVEVYGSAMAIRDLANVTKSEATQLVVKPYDANNTGAIAKAIEAANMGVTTVAEGDHVRVSTPPMSEEVREKMVKYCQELAEECKVSVRHARQEGNKLVRKLKGDGEISEDEMKRDEKKIQELTDQFCKEADEVCSEKQKQVSTI